MSHQFRLSDQRGFFSIGIGLALFAAFGVAGFTVQHFNDGSEATDAEMTSQSVDRQDSSNGSWPGSLLSTRSAMTKHSKQPHDH
ncbi:MAG: hypothetical protein ABFS45_06425 [Pseudomonadota bacterium]